MFAAGWILLLPFATVVVAVAAAVVAAAAAAADTVASALCTEEFVADCYLAPWDLVHSVGMTVTSRPLGSSSDIFRAGGKQIQHHCE